MNKQSDAARFYTAARNHAEDALGGKRAFAIAGPTIRRMAIAAAILDLAAVQDNTIAGDTVRNLVNDLYDLLGKDGATEWL